MHRTAQTRQAVNAGRKRGAVLGVLVFLALGLVSGFSLGSYAVLILSAHMTGQPLAPGWLSGSLAAAGGMVGVVTAATISITAGWFGGGVFAAVAVILGQFLHDRREERERAGRGMRMLPHGRMAERAQAELRARLSFLQNCRHMIHSIIVVGSAAHQSDASGSDVDIAILCRKDGLETVQSAVAGQELDEALAPRSGRALEITVIGPRETEELFELASPFSFALGRGVVLADDGHLGSLLGRAPRAPGRKYALTALFRNIMVLYYGSFRSLHRSAKANNCSSACCGERRSGCTGIAATDVPATVLMRMLYVTLPLRGCMPLTKQDVVAFTRMEYGDESAEAAQRAVALSRSGEERIYYSDYTMFKRLAGMLYREILAAAGTGRAVSRMLQDGACMAQARYGQLKDHDLRRCVQ
ncbi:MAG: nucleotidyltransferase domain-containing protein [Nitrospirota bacterium]